MVNAAPNLTVSAQLADVLRKCTPKPYRPALQLAPHNWSCRCGAVALVCEEDSAWCADCALPVFGIDDLYAVTKGYDENGDVLGAALDGFSRWAERTYDEMTDREWCGGLCGQCSAAKGAV